MSSLQLNPYIAHIYHHHRRYKTLYGGRGSGKSVGIADCMLLKSMQGQKVACFREFQNKIEDSVYTLLQEEIERHKLTGYKVLSNRIEHRSGGVFKFHGMARDPDGIQSMQGFQNAWIEEAHVISEKSLNKLTPTFRKRGCEIWLGGNPQRREDVFSQRFIENKLRFKLYQKIEYNGAHMRCKLNYMDNPWYWETDLEIERKEAFEIFDRAMYDHVWLGEYNDSIENSIIKAEWVDAAVDAHKKWHKFGLITATFDPADNRDARATVIRHGNTIIKLHEETRLDINDSCEQACEMAWKHRATSFIYDATGCGLGLRRQINDYFGNRVTVSEFHGGATAQNPNEVAIEIYDKKITNKEYFKNRRAQLYFELSERFRKTYQYIKHGKHYDPSELISIASDAGDIQRFKSELTSVARKLNAERVYQLLSKQEMIDKLKVKSPNLADCAMMSEMIVEDSNEWFGTAQKRNRMA